MNFLNEELFLIISFVHSNSPGWSLSRINWPRSFISTSSRLLRWGSGEVEGEIFPAPRFLLQQYTVMAMITIKATPPHTQATMITVVLLDSLSVGGTAAVVVTGVTRVDSNELWSAEITWPFGSVIWKVPALTFVSILVISCSMLAVVWPFLGTATKSTTILPAVKLKSCILHSSRFDESVRALIMFASTAAFWLSFPIMLLYDTLKANLTLTPELFGSSSQAAVVGAAVVGAGVVTSSLFGPTNALRYPNVVQLHST